MEQLEFIAQVWLGSFISDLVRYFLGAGGVFLIVYVLFKKQLAGRKIRTKHPRAKQMWREIRASMGSVAIYGFVGFLTFFGARVGIIEFYGDIETHGWLYFWGSIFLMIVAHDAYFYWTHRLLHHPKLMRLSHYYHHKSMNPSPWTAYSFDPIETAVNAVFVPLFLLFVPMNHWATFIFMGHMIVRNAIGHSGYELFPRSWAKHPILGQINLVTHHDLHHANGQYNYGLYFSWWDRLMGTEHPEYVARASGDATAVYNMPERDQAPSPS